MRLRATAGSHEKTLALGPVSRILFPQLHAGFGWHFSCAPLHSALAGLRGAHRPCTRLSPGSGRCDIPETIGRAVQSLILSCTGRGFSCRSPHGARGGLLPHLFTMTRRSSVKPSEGGLPVFCDTIRHRGLTRGACACAQHPAQWCPDFPLQVHTSAAANRALGSKNSERQPGPKAKEG
jgi:hypothetical protein